MLASLVSFFMLTFQPEHCNVLRVFHKNAESKDGLLGVASGLGLLPLCWGKRKRIRECCSEQYGWLFMKVLTKLSSLYFHDLVQLQQRIYWCISFNSVHLLYQSIHFFISQACTCTLKKKKEREKNETNKKRFALHPCTHLFRARVSLSNRWLLPHRQKEVKNGNLKVAFMGSLVVMWYWLRLSSGAYLAAGESQRHFLRGQMGNVCKVLQELKSVRQNWWTSLFCCVTQWLDISCGQILNCRCTG